MRTARRVFISYQREATPAAAHQLACELQRLGCEAQLGGHSGTVAVEIEAQLDSRLDQVDFVILLATSMAHSSPAVVKALEPSRGARGRFLAIDCGADRLPVALPRSVDGDLMLSLIHAIIDPDDPFSAKDLGRILERVQREMG